jgi:hypothetical protein
VTFTPDAVEETGHRMIDAATQARADPGEPQGSESEDWNLFQQS